ncbi:hypothetical protein E2I00_015273 [Balaenoptera physalus]|uniref:Uncharacterized protein n=1 Tax=Balaenoptera physalus TaxID=9770 RepID=A0A643C1R7_BALPH|nr:hypothetical protein E2I00_015273 [Balaenoptera physalus]
MEATGHGVGEAIGQEVGEAIKHGVGEATGRGDGEAAGSGVKEAMGPGVGDNLAHGVEDAAHALGNTGSEADRQAENVIQHGVVAAHSSWQGMPGGNGALGQGSSGGGEAVNRTNTLNSQTSPGLFNFDAFWMNLKSMLGFINWDAINKGQLSKPSTRILLYFRRLWENFKRNTPFLNWKAIIEWGVTISSSEGITVGKNVPGSNEATYDQFLNVDKLRSVLEGNEFLNWHALVESVKRKLPFLNWDAFPKLRGSRAAADAQ